jgi:putative CocE/NonD family hydrolase
MSMPAEALAVRVIEHLFIPLADGTRLAARIWLPADAERHPVPAILEYIPYRKRDGTRVRDEPMHGYFAAQGYAAVRVDLRGSGDSDGALDDEYLMLEQDDAVEVIAWLAAQPWCNGAVGMMGKSWGGFNALQVAARRPPALKAIITVCSTDDRFADDVHYKGGCLLNDNLWWGSIMLAYQARPPDPALVGDGWRRQWLERIERMPFFPALWLAHQRRDSYWRHGSVACDFAAITCPVFAVGGWADAYTNAVFRLLAGLSVPRLGLVGPWAHVYPHDGVPGPAIGFLQEAVRWWDCWLKGSDDAIMAEPMLRVYLQDFSTPGQFAQTAPGRWAGEKAWPSPRIAERSYAINAGGLAAAAEPPARCAVRSPHTTGAAAGEWMGTGISGEQPGDQRLDDGFSLVFDSEPLPERMDILGAPVAELELSADSPVAQLCLRLSDVAPDGTACRVSYETLNLTHRDDPAAPTPLVPGERYRIRVTLNHCGHAFPAGHRIRLALSSAYWPMVWPAPQAATLTVVTGTGRLILPERPPDPADNAIAFAPPTHGPRTPTTAVAPGRNERSLSFDVLNRIARFHAVSDGVFGEGEVRLDEIGISQSHRLQRDLAIAPDDPLSASAHVSQTYATAREGGKIRIETLTVMRATATDFMLEGQVEVFENDEQVARRSWNEVIKRDLV